MLFDEAFDLLLGHEGGYVNDKRDPGGETKWGISHRSYPALDIKNLTKDEAKAIYRRDYWDKCRIDELPAKLRYTVFDMAVNSGVSAAVKTLQRAVHVKDDGILGPVTMAAVGRFDAGALTARFCGARLNMMASLPTWSAFGKGWARRIAAILMEC